MGGDYCCIENKLARLGVTVSNLKNTVTQLNGLTSTVNTIQNNITSLTTTINSQTSKLSTLTSDVNDLQEGVGSGVFTGSISVSGSINTNSSFNTAMKINSFALNATSPVLTGTLSYIPVFQGPGYKKYLFILQNAQYIASSGTFPITLPFSSGNLGSISSPTYSAPNFFSNTTIYGQLLQPAAIPSATVNVEYTASTSSITIYIPTATVTNALIELEGF